MLLRGVSPLGTAEGATGERLELDSRGRVLHTLPPAGGAPPLPQRGRQFALVVQLLAAQAALAGALEPARSAATQAPWALLPRAGASPRLLRLLRGATPVGAPLAPLAPPAAPLTVSVLMDLSGVTVIVPAPAGCAAARLTLSGRGRADEGFLACLAHHVPSGAGEYSLALRGLEALEAYAERVAAIGAGLQELLGELQGEAAAAPQGQALLLVSYAVPTPPAVLLPALAAAEAAEAAEAAAAAGAALAAPWAAGAAAAGSLQAGAAGVEAGLAAAGKAQAAALAGDERVARRGGVEGEKLAAVGRLVDAAVPSGRGSGAVGGVTEAFAAQQQRRAAGAPPGTAPAGGSRGYCRLGCTWRRAWRLGRLCRCGGRCWRAPARRLCLGAAPQVFAAGGACAAACAARGLLRAG